MGWFTSLYPAKIVLPTEHAVGELVSTVKDTLRQIPNQGIGYGAICGYTAAELPLIAFNYLGQYDTSNTANWSFVHEDTGTPVSSANKAQHLLTINCAVLHGRFIFDVSGQLPTSVLSELLENYKLKLTSIVNELQAQHTRTYLTLSDVNYIISKKHLENIQRNAVVEGVYLANSLQQGFIFHGLNQGKNDASYRTQLFWNYEQAIAVETLEKAWMLAQQKYAALRLRFSWEDELVQVIDTDGTLDWRYVDISNEPEEEQTLLFKALCEKDRDEPYDFTASGLFRVYLVKRSNTLYNCIFNNHHAIMDGWSNPILLQTIHDFYLKLVSNETFHPKPDKVYATTQLYLQNTKEEHLDYFKDSLSRLDEQENLSALLRAEKRLVNIADYKHVINKSEQQITISGSRYTDFKKACAAHDITVNAFLQYCWHRQLRVYSGSQTTVVGMIVSGRAIAVKNMEAAVGLYINTLPVILEHKDDTLIELVKTLQNEINEVSSKSNVNLAKLQKGGNRLFNSLFAFENYPIPKNKEPALAVKFIGANENFDYPLAVAVFDMEQELIFKLSYASELFDESLIREMLIGVEATIHQFISNPLIKTKDMKYLLDEARLEEIVYTWNVAHNVIPRISNLKDLFEAQALRTPTNTAFVSENIALTYGELNTRANQLANYLLSLYKPKPDDLIAICQSRSAYLLISILAVLKAGAAYVPMDTEAPKERLRFMLEDTQSQILLADHASFHDLKRLTADLPMVTLDVTATVITEFSMENPPVEVKPTDLAYVIYTSGTTGRPKGVMITHEGVVALSDGMEYLHTKYSIVARAKSAYKRCLWYSNVVFDAHVYDVFPALLQGDCVYMVANNTRYDFNKLNAFIADHKIDFGLIPPALLDKMNPIALDTLMVGGEATSWDVIEAHLAAGIPVVNLYGPTEITVASSYHVFKPGDSNTNIGRPLPHASSYVLDENLHVLPVGAVGELHIGGIGVSRGYLHNPELTAEKFIINPFQSAAEAATHRNARLYKTGDLVRYLSNGEIEYIGRKDFQVKIRGFRVELGEIERILAGYDAIHKVVVLAKTQGNGMKFLVSYYAAPCAYATATLQTYLKGYLPDYMIPTVFIQVDDFPMTTSGKLDEKKLPVPLLEDVETYIAPASVLEEQLCGLYADVLGLSVDKISVEADFFQLGGDSITAIKLQVRVAKGVDKNIDLPTILQFSTIRSLALCIANSADTKVEKIVPIRVKEDEQLLSFSQERLWFMETYEGGSATYNIPLVFELQKKVRKELLTLAIEKVIQRHEVLRSYIKTNENGFGYQEVMALDGGAILTERAVDKQHLRALLHNSTNKTFHLATERPIHMQYYELDDKTYISVVIHHIAFDGWSVDILMKELVHYYTYYEAQQEGQQLISDLPDLAIQYKDYALWQRGYLTEKRLAKAISYWENELSDYEILNLPTDKPRPKKVDYRGDNVLFTISTELSADLRLLAKKAHISLYSVLLSGYYLLLSSFSNQKDILVGTPVAGRSQQGTDQLIGFFVNTLVLRGKINPEESLLDFMKKIAELVKKSQEHQDLPFEKLVQHLQVKQDASRNPIFQTLFTVQSFGKEENFNDLLKAGTEEMFGGAVAQFDMAMLVDDREASLKGMINYATALFESETIQRYIDTYITILQQLVLAVKSRAENRVIKAISYVSKDTFDRTIKTYQGIPKAIPNKTLQAAFEDQVKKNPNKIAFVYGSLSFTFTELNEKANKLAHYLIGTLSVQPDDLIAIYQDRSENMLISILGILKSGAAYVPIDPAIPEARLAFISKDTSAKAILVHTAQAKHVKDKLGENPVALVDVESAIIERYPATDPKTETRPQHLAYVIYTSGTTGQPKGVMIAHQGVLNLAYAQEDIMEKVNGRDHHDGKNLLWYYNYIFDGHVYELYHSLLKGYTIHLVDETTRLDYNLLSHYITEHRISAAAIPPVLLQTDHILNLKTLVVAGEVSNQEIVNKYLAHGVQVLNSYGPTECTVCSSQHLFSAGDSICNIGRPLANVSYYVLNEYAQLLPIGAIGELHIGGAGVARGYLNNEELTAEKFIRNPFQTNQEKIKGQHAVLYKTGDLVRYLGNGEIEYIGRKDFQVKIRGYRIELGEIEQVLLSYEDMNQAVVIAKTHTNGMVYLLAYYVAPTDYSAADLKAHLGRYLPSYMLPYDFIKLRELPMTANGKLDKKKLPSPTFADKEEAFVAPKNTIQKQLVEIYAEILALEPASISMADDFFQLGGSSIVAIRLVMKVNNYFKTKISVMDLFNAPSIATLSKVVDGNKGTYKPLIALHTNNLPNLFMIHPAMADADVYLGLANRLKDAYTCYGINSYNLAHDVKIDNLSALAHYYLEQIKTIQTTDSYNLLGWSLGGRLALEIASQLEKEGMKNNHVFLLDTWMINDGMGKNAAEKEQTMQKMMDSFAIPAANRALVREVLLAEDVISSQPISAVLEYTTIVLFRAVADDNTTALRELYTNNHVESCIRYAHQLKTIDIPCQHNDILNFDTIIADAIASVDYVE